jgi:hypothetical protein
MHPRTARHSRRGVLSCKTLGRAGRVLVVDQFDPGE